MKPEQNLGYYEKQAQYYDVIYAAQGKDYPKEAKQIHDEIEKHKKSVGNALLDVGCGTGGHFPFLKEWYQTEGLDLDGHMLAVARSRFPDATFHQGDMSDFDLGKQFDAVTCLFSAIGYTKTPEKMQAAIASMAQHVSPGGVLLVEPWFAPEQWKAKLGRPSVTNVDQPELKITRMNVSEMDGNVSILNFHFLVATPGHMEHFTEKHELGLFTQDEYLKGFIDAGLEVTHDPGGLTGRGLYIGTKKVV